MAAAREGDRLSNLPESIRIHILSKLPSKQVVQTSVLSSQWVSHWKSVPASLKFESTDDEDVSGFVRSVYRELFYWESCDKIKSFSICPSTYSGHVMDSDLYFWLHFSTYIAKVEEFSLKFCVKAFPEIVYDFPEFAYTNTVLRNLVLGYCWLRPSGNVKWSNLVSLSIGDAVMTEGVMEKVLSGCPNLECLELDKVVGIRCLDITSAKLTKLIVTIYETDYDEDHCLEIHAPHIRHLELLGLCYDKIHFQLRNVASLVTALISVEVYFADLEENLEKECKYLQELLHHVANVKNLELGPWCIEKLLSMYSNEDERRRRFETNSFNCSLPHLKFFKFINFRGKPSEKKFVHPLIKCLCKNATALKKSVIACNFRRRDVFWDFVVRRSASFSYLSLLIILRHSLLL